MAQVPPKKTLTVAPAPKRGERQNAAPGRKIGRFRTMADPGLAQLSAPADPRAVSDAFRSSGNAKFPGNGRQKRWHGEQLSGKGDGKNSRIIL